MIMTRRLIEILFIAMKTVCLQENCNEIVQRRMRYIKKQYQKKSLIVSTEQAGKTSYAGCNELVRYILYRIE